MKIAPLVPCATIRAPGKNFRPLAGNRSSTTLSVRCMSGDQPVVVDTTANR
jgi:hypothetical protein